jgi:hypothetical protein
MNELEQELKRRLPIWRVASPEAGLADRIVARAVAEPQDLPLIFRLRQALIAGLSEWRVGLNYKLASFALCAVVGLGIGLYQASVPIDVEVSGVAFDDNSLGGEI